MNNSSNYNTLVNMFNIYNTKIIGIEDESLLKEIDPKEITFFDKGYENLKINKPLDYYEEGIKFLIFHNCYINELSFQQGSISVAILKNCTIEKVSIYDTEMSISMGNCRIKNFSLGNGQKNFNVTNCIVQNCHIDFFMGFNAKNILINENKRISEIFIGNTKSLKILDQNFDQIEISLSGIKNIQLSKQRIKKLSINQSMELNGNLELSNIDELNLNSSNFKDVVFSNSDFNSIKKFNILSSDYDGIKINDLKYPKQLIDRNIHRLLKKIAIQNNDLINGKLQGIQELICYRKELWKEGKFLDWFPLWAGFWTNKYGSSIKYAFSSWIIASLVLFLLASAFHSLPLLEQLNSGRYFIFAINPTHSIDSVFPNLSKEIYQPTITAIDYAGRVVIAFMIFQIISAFRFFFKNN